jgi:hypothetical protein
VYAEDPRAGALDVFEQRPGAPQMEGVRIDDEGLRIERAGDLHRVEGVGDAILELGLGVEAGQHHVRHHEARAADGGGGIGDRPGDPSRDDDQRRFPTGAYPCPAPTAGRERVYSTNAGSGI